jgi:bifunctional DNA-binding transcriptional regulator/antitoxin component of YhaV-PrlF toxin-antitoxin module
VVLRPLIRQNPCERVFVMLREPAEITITDDGSVSLPLGLLAEAGLSPGSKVLAYSRGDGCIVLRREADALQELLETGGLA